MDFLLHIIVQGAMDKQWLIYYGLVPNRGQFIMQTNGDPVFQGKHASLENNELIEQSLCH